MKLLLLVCCLSVLLGSAFVVQYQWKRFLEAPVLASGVKVLVDVERGATLNRVLRQLNQKYGVELGWQWRYLHWFRPEWTKVKAGEYQVDLGAPPAVFIEQLINSPEYQHALTIVEGVNRYQLVESLNKQLKTNVGLELLDSIVGEKYQHAEGLFLAETFFFSKDTPVEQVLQRAHQSLMQELESLWKNRDTRLPFNSAYEALILASIIEKESAVSSEKSTIASVFINRLNKGMRLQTDPTVIYGIWDEYQGDIKRVHLQRKTPYNTYRINGLPPTPIAMVGLQSLHAVFNPAQTDYYYFVASGDGGHVFSKTLEQHNQAVRNYLNRK